MGVVQLPSDHDVQQLFEHLFGKDVIAKLSATPFSGSAPGVRLPFVDSDGGVRVVCVADLPATASLGAALTMVPAAQAKADADAGEVRDSILENFHEVANIMSSMFQQVGAVPLTLGVEELEVTATTELPGEVTIATFDVQIDGYQSGTVAFWMT